jgi:O-antigen/teichoic acid export membrane protein
MLKQMLEYCLVLAVWSGSMLCISGLDVTIVGHYAFTETGFYSIAVAPTNLIVAVWAAVLGPLIPAASALSAQRTAVDMGHILSRATRYATLLLFLSGLPLLVGGYAVLRLWVGSAYALHGVRYLRILVLANILRNLCAPYATMVVATGKQKFATAAAISEALVNLTSSLYFASRIGALGVALGTLLGAVVSVSMHFALSMRYTYKTLAISRTLLLQRDILRPSIIAIPSVLLVPFWWSSVVPSLDLQIWLPWALSTVLLLWFGSLTAEERNHVRTMVLGVK